ncbi:Protein of unknown function [Reichenbachiella faecimaris]|uniref:Alpha-1,2-mannosyltransferase n=1 Tax=Reichenbachiella faecimaris TaxID=692418 RepID=A0A1W2G5V7_REIFA|nr:polyprenol phosphomannose-dependent alpha 1,6 mannosyltransferase MptB [Reichenbachiella faecimaris]SMD32047.1 Protein of unknown function [Reichenbachiella faecimaris]
MPKKPLGWTTAWLGFGLVLPILFLHYETARNSAWLLSLFGISFVAYGLLYFKSEFSFKQILIVAIFIRLALFFGAPTLSDDYFRFIWDGHIRAEGINPYESTPAELIKEQPENLNEVFEKLNSQEYHSTYPPFSQYVFSIPSYLGIKSLFWTLTTFRIILLLFEIGVIWLLFQLTSSASRVVLYALNPLVILELIGNVHFEGMVLFFILLAWWFYEKGNWKKAALALSFGVLTKLTPLMFLPVLFRKLGWQKSIKSYALIGVSIVFFSLPFLDFQMLDGMGSGLDLFFRKFEFNAGLFFLMRAIGYWVKGYDVVQTVGPWLSVIAFGLIMTYCLYKVKEHTDWAKAFTIILLIQLIFATTVHPWYVIPLIAFGCMSGYAFPIIWSGLVFVSYSGYTENGYQHPMIWIAIEYFIVIGVASFELYKNKTLLKHV